MHDSVELIYHHATFDLLERTPTYNVEASALLEQCERRLGYTLPAAVREWYMLTGADEILQEFSNDDYPLAIAQLADDADRLPSVSAPDGRVTQLLPFLYENQGVYVCAIHLYGSDDPPVSARDDDEAWTMWATHFSEFICGWVWHHFYWTEECVLRAEDRALTEADVCYLRQYVDDAPDPSPSTRIYHLRRADQHIHIWRRHEDEAWWWLRAASEESLFRLAQLVWPCGTLAETLRFQGGYVHNCAGRVLDRLRRNSPPPHGRSTASAR